MPKPLPVAFDPVRKQLFVENLTLGLDPRDAARASGFTGRLHEVVKRLMEDEEVLEMIAAHKRELERRYDVSREKVLRDLVDAKEMARVQADVKGMVMAINPIIDVMGYRAPKELKVETTNHNSTNVRKRLRLIRDEELIELAEEAGFETLDLLPTTVDGEVEEHD